MFMFIIILTPSILSTNRVHVNGIFPTTEIYDIALDMHVSWSHYHQQIYIDSVLGYFSISYDMIFSPTMWFLRQLFWRQLFLWVAMISVTNRMLAESLCCRLVLSKPCYDVDFSSIKTIHCLRKHECIGNFHHFPTVESKDPFILVTA